MSSPAAVGSLALELRYGFLLELYEGQGHLQGLQLEPKAIFRAWQLVDAVDSVGAHVTRCLSHGF